MRIWMGRGRAPAIRRSYMCALAPPCNGQGREKGSLLPGQPAKGRRAAGRNAALKGLFVFEAPADRAALGRPIEAEEIAGLVFYLAVLEHVVLADQGGPNAMLAVRTVGDARDAADPAVIFEARLEILIDHQPRLPSDRERCCVVAVAP